MRHVLSITMVFAGAVGSGHSLGHPSEPQAEGRKGGLQHHPVLEENAKEDDLFSADPAMVAAADTRRHYCFAGHSLCTSIPLATHFPNNRMAPSVSSDFAGYLDEHASR